MLLWPILMRVESDGSVPAGMSNIAASMLGFFSTRMAIDSVFGMLLVMPTGTTAPFSAMSGVDTKVIALLGVGALGQAGKIRPDAMLWHLNRLVGR